MIGLRDSLKDLTSVGDEYQNKLVGFAEELKRFGQQVAYSEATTGQPNTFCIVVKLTSSAAYMKVVHYFSGHEKC